MDREDFMDIVYSELHSDGDNNRANRIIEAADEYVTDKNVRNKISKEPLELARAIDGLTEWQKHVQTDSNINRDISIAIEALKAQLGTNLAEVGTDCISRQAAIDVVKGIDSHFVKYVEQLPPAQPEPCEDAVKSHSEKDVLNMCISLLDEMVGYFSEYMEWIGYEPTEEEKECGYFGMTYFHIVQKLFLYHTTHSGGTSTFKKCHELGIDDPSDGVRFPMWKEEEGDAE